MRYGVKARTVTSLRMAKSHFEVDEAMIKYLGKHASCDVLIAACCKVFSTDQCPKPLMADFVYGTTA